MLIQVIIVGFALFALSRTVLRFREGGLSRIAVLAWGLVWVGVGAVALLPDSASWFASIIGVGRGADAVIYLAVIVLFYLMFRIFLRLEKIEHDITLLVREISTDDGKEGKDDDASS